MGTATFTELMGVETFARDPAGAPLPGNDLFAGLATASSTTCTS